MTEDDSTGAWVFAAIAVHHRRCSLAEVVASADWINHAILLDRELEESLGLLAGGGLVRVFDDWTFELTDEGTDLWDAQGRDLRSGMDAVRRHLADLGPGRAEVRLPSGRFDDAVAEYRRAIG